jgi:hypothetical protein
MPAGPAGAEPVVSVFEPRLISLVQEASTKLASTLKTMIGPKRMQVPSDMEDRF